MTFAELLDKRLVFVSGKGGVGKTTLTVLIGLAAARRGKNALLVEMNSGGMIPPLFGAAVAEEEPVALAPNLSGLNLRPKNCFEEYVLKHVRFKSVYELIFNNRFVSNFLEATPGLNEILMLGKLYDLEGKRKATVADGPLYDIIVVDMPATGHGLSAMEVPHVLMAAVKIGPLHANAAKIIALCGDAAKTAFCLVTLAEEMPVCETEEFRRDLKNKTNVAFGPLFVNAVQAPPSKLKSAKAANLPEDLRHYRDYHELARSRADLNRRYLKEIDAKFSDLTRITLPFLYREVESAKDLKELSDVLEAR